MNDVPDNNAKYKSLRCFLLYGCVIVLLSFSWMFRKISVPNERTRIYLAVSVVDDGALSIDHSVKRFGRTGDLARFEGRFYTDKAPGSSFVGAVVYRAVRLVSPPSSWTVEQLVNLMRTYVMIPFGILGFWLLRRFLTRLQIGPQSVDLVSLVWILGTAAFHYSTAFYAHQLAAVGFLAALNLAYFKDGTARRQMVSMLGAGAAVGFAGSMEYQSAIAAIIFLLFVGWHHRSPRLIALFVLGATPFALLLLGYNWACFGSPLELSYNHLVSKKLQADHNLGIGGVSFPKAVATFGSLLSLHRGLLTTSPVFLLTPMGLRSMWRAGHRHLTVLLGSTSAYYLLFIFSADAWFGGWSFGPRLLVPMMAFAMIPIAFSAERLRKSPFSFGLFMGLIVTGIAYHQLVHLVFPELPDTAQNPMRDVVIQALGEGRLSPNLVSRAFGKPTSWSPWVAGVVTFIAFIVIRSQQQQENQRLKYLKRIFGCLLPMGTLTLAIALAPASWSQKRTDKFLRWMGKMDKKEFPINAKR